MDRIVIDTNVLVSALRSKRGASYRLLDLLYDKKFEVAVSVALVFEYEDAVKRDPMTTFLGEQELNLFLADICLAAVRQRIFFLWRPLLKDPKDEHLLELAIASNSRFIITYNKKDFMGVEQFGISVLDPKEYLLRIGEIK